MLLIDAETSLRELLGEAETDEDFAAVEELIAENETKNGKPAASGRWIVSTIAELAEAMGFATQTVYQWRADPTMPGELGAFSVPDVVQWRFAKMRGGGDLAVAKKEQDLELGKVELDTKRMELAKQKGELLDSGDVERWAATALIEAREMVMALPEMLATSSPPAQREFIRSETDRHCRDVLVALRRRLESDSIASDAAPSTAAEDPVE